jgi:hypothetical protein
MLSLGIGQRPFYIIISKLPPKGDILPNRIGKEHILLHDDAEHGVKLLWDTREGIVMASIWAQDNREIFEKRCKK